jgi:hypothetical protein
MRRRGAAAQTRRVRELELEKVMDQGSPQLSLYSLTFVHVVFSVCGR